MQQSNTLTIVLLVVVILAVAYFIFMRPQTPTIVQAPSGNIGQVSNTTLWATSIMNLLGGIGNSIAAGFNASNAGQNQGQQPVTQ